MAISRDTHDPTKNYRRIRYHQDRDLLDSELNEQQDIQIAERRKIGDTFLQEGAILAGLSVVVTDNVLTVGEGSVYIEGGIESVSGEILTYEAGVGGVDYVYLELLKYNYGQAQDATLINPATGEPTAEREKWVLHLKATDTSGDGLPPNATERVVVKIHKFDRDAGTVVPVVGQLSNFKLADFAGTLPGERIAVASISEDQMNIEAAEGLGSMLSNMAERTFDESGSYLVEGLDSSVGGNDGSNVEIITNAGRAYVGGYRNQKNLPTVFSVPKSNASKAVTGEQKTFADGTRRYPLNSTPVKDVTELLATVEITKNITRGSVGGGQDLLVPNPVVDIKEVTQGATTFVEGVDWQQSGNYVDWLGQNEPAIGTTYSVRYTYTKQMLFCEDYVVGGWFGETAHPAAGEYYYLVTVVTASGETEYDPSYVFSRVTGAGGINRITWLAVAGALNYYVWRATQNTGRLDFQRLAVIDSGVHEYLDDGADELQAYYPQEENSSGTTMSTPSIELADLNLVNFGRTDVGDSPEDGSNVSVTYEYYIGRKDVIYATTSGLNYLQGPPADNPKAPVVPDDALALCSVDCPADSVEMEVENFGLVRVTMEEIHQLKREIEDLKYNDAQFQITTELQNRTSATKKGIYSDDFSSKEQSDEYHADWDARIDTLRKFAAPDRDTTSNTLSVNGGASTCLKKASVAMLPATEVALVTQVDWSEERDVNPYSVFEQPDATLLVIPNVGRRSQTTAIVTGMNFTPNANNITVKCDGIAVGSGVTADASGRFTHSFTIPAAASLGERIISATDTVRAASTNLQINAEKVITRIERIVFHRPRFSFGRWFRHRIVRRPVRRRVWRWGRRTKRRDPLAQTFNFTENKVISAIGLYFTARDTTDPVTIQVRGVTTGLPNDIVFAEKALAPGEITLDAETKVVFDDPIYCDADTSYAVVILSGSDAYKVRTATLGATGQNGIITSQVYAAGVLLESSNAETWTPLNGSDLTMKIYGYEFMSSGVLQFNAVTANFSELNLDEYSAIPEGTSIIWEYSLDGGSSWSAFVPEEEEDMPNVASGVILRATFATESDNNTPALNFKDVTLLTYLNKTSGAYITREYELAQSVASTKVYAQMNVPSGCTVTFYATNDSGTTWDALSVEATRPIDSEWTEYTLGGNFTDDTKKNVRYKAVFTGTTLVYPRIHTLGATLS